MRIFVSSLDYEADESAVKTLFEPFGEVQSIKIIKDLTTGRSKGFCFVEMENAAAQNAITELNGKKFFSRKLLVRIAQPKNNENTGKRKGPISNQSGGYRY
jgi:RNA recognition motif-containing protein